MGDGRAGWPAAARGAPLFIVVERVGRRFALTPALSPEERERDARFLLAALPFFPIITPSPGQVGPPRLAEPG